MSTKPIVVKDRVTKSFEHHESARGLGGSSSWEDTVARNNWTIYDYSVHVKSVRPSGSSGPDPDLDDGVLKFSGRTKYEHQFGASGNVKYTVTALMYRVYPFGALDPDEVDDRLAFQTMDSSPSGATYGSVLQSMSNNLAAFTDNHDLESMKYPKSPRWLDAASDGVTAKIVAGLSHGTRWKIEQDGNYVRLRSWNNHYHTDDNPRWLDGASDGTMVKLVDGASHGTRWKIEDNDGFVRLRNFNHHFLDDNNARWLDGASDGTTVKLVNGKSHGTRWRIEDRGDTRILRCLNNNYIGDDVF